MFEHAHSQLLTIYVSIYNYISHKNGGQGCVREIIEQVLRVQGKWSLDIGAGKD